MQDDVFDALIVGGGPAGLAAAYYLARFRRRVRLMDAGNSRAAWVPVSHNHAGFPDGIRGPELLRRMRRQARRYGAVLEQEEIQEVRVTAGGFEALSTAGRCSAPMLLLATGVVDVKPEVPDLPEAVRDGLIRYCPVCDAYEAGDRNIAVIGWGDSGFGEADFLRDFSDKVAVLTQGAAFDRGDARYRRLLDRGITVIETPIARLVADPPDAAIHVTLAGGRRHDFDVVYSAMGYRPRNGLALMLGARLGPDQRLLVNDHQETSVRNCFAAGDVVHGLNQISVAIGQSAVAAVTMHNRLREMYRGDHGSSRRIQTAGRSQAATGRERP